MDAWTQHNGGHDEGMRARGCLDDTVEVLAREQR